jgi:hypothetical protein
MDKIKDNLLDILEILKLGEGALYQKHLVKLSKKSRRQIQRDIRGLSELGYVKTEFICNNNIIYLTRKYYNNFFNIDKKTSNTKTNSTLIRNYLIAYANLNPIYSEFITNDIFNTGDKADFRGYLYTNKSINKYPHLKNKKIFVDIDDLEKQKLIKVLIIKNDISESSFSKFVDILIEVLKGYEGGKCSTIGEVYFNCFVLTDEEVNEYSLNRKNEQFIFIKHIVKT